jgi:PPOX class probable F420-dependent enzyme
MPKVMSREERETFLAGVHVGVLSVAAGDARGPLTTPVWYTYEPGGPVRFQTLPRSRKASLIEATGRASLCVQDEVLPYRYVTVEGPARGTGRRPGEAWSRALHHRYLGPEVGDMVYEATAPMLEDEVLFELQPERWTSSDYTDDFAAS